MKTTVYLIAGEVSGDMHGAELMESLRELFEDPQFLGLGGPQMRQKGSKMEDWLDEAAVLGVWEVLKKYGYFRTKMNETIADIMGLKPDVLVLIDYPGFNLRLAKALRQQGYKGKIAYYISPQVWAWKRGRIKEMGRTLDLMICIFPFEKELYEESGLRTEFAGHPLIDELAHKRVNLVRDENLIGLFPGSRSREVEALYPTMAAAAHLLSRKNPDLRFVSAAVNDNLASRMQEIAQEAGADEIEITTGNVHVLMQTVSCAAIASGTATLEAAYFRLPYVLVYKVAWLTAMIARVVMKVKYLGIVNNLANQEVVRELLQEDFTPQKLADELSVLVHSPEEREALQSKLDEVILKLGEGGAHERAAQAIHQLTTDTLPESTS